ncbi:carboxymuconolactone decarboxylase family protein [Ensifer sp. 4252]|uniref:carboxymuconolactone decarboxylase family protein n=1 Tax=Ensifer sp. 4252 TaxID=3373915 RepID=UPI003D1FBF8A
MSRIPTPASIDDAPAASQPMLKSVMGRMGRVPNIYRIAANSPIALKGLLDLSQTLSEGELPAADRERIAIAVAETNGCDYCLSAHTYLAKHVAKLSDLEISANRNGRSIDLGADAVVHLATELVRTRGHVRDTDVAAVKEAGYSDAELLEIVLHAALNTFTNYLNEAFETEIDFPSISTRAA